MYALIKVDGVELASPSSVNITRELLWSSSTGRSAKTGKMIGSVIATKRTLEVEWTNITSSQYSTIRSALSAGFFGPVEYESSAGNEIITMDKAYRSSFTDTDKGYIGRTHYYTVKVSIIEQ